MRQWEDRHEEGYTDGKSLLKTERIELLLNLGLESSIGESRFVRQYEISYAHILQAMLTYSSIQAKEHLLKPVPATLRSGRRNLPIFSSIVISTAIATCPLNIQRWDDG